MRNKRLLLAGMALVGCASAAWRWGGDLPIGGSPGTQHATSAYPKRHAASHSTQRFNAAAGTPVTDFGFDPYLRFNPIASCGTGCSYGYDFEQVKVADLTGDGRDDLVAVPSDNQVWVITQLADGSLDTAHPIVFTYAKINYQHPPDLMIGDVNEDGILDAVTATIDDTADHVEGGINVITSKGGNGLKFIYIPPPFAAGQRWEFGSLLDVNLDGHLDLVAHAWGNSGGGVWRMTFAGDGRGGFAPAVSTGVLGPWAPMGSADFNDDGLMDFAYALDSIDQTAFGLVYNNRTSGFGDAVPLGLGLDVGAAHAYGDVNHDGRTDIVAAPNVLLQGVDGKFKFAYQFPMGTPYPKPMLAVDLDGDGLTDLMSSQFDGFGSFAHLETYLQRDGVLELMAEPGPYLADNVTQNAGLWGVGDLNSDGCTDVAMASPSGILVFYSHDCMHTPAAMNDFDGDRKSDLLWRNAASTGTAVWKSASSAMLQYLPSVASAWSIAGSGDFDNDGKADILWRNRITGANAYWRAGAAHRSVALSGVAGTDWSIVGIGDFDGNGKSDILWHQASSGSNRLWIDGHSASMRALAAVPGVDWSVEGVADFDGDRKADLLWHNRHTGASVIWSGGDSTRRRALTTITDPAWTIMGVADFDGDGKADLFWRNVSTGMNAIWNSANSASSRAVTAVTNQTWSVQTVGDYNADGKADLFWRNSATGANVVWLSASAGWQLPVAPVKDMQWVAR